MFSGTQTSVEAVRDLTELRRALASKPDRVRARMEPTLDNEQDETFYASRSYVTLAANQAGLRRIRLPKLSDVRDPFAHPVPAAPGHVVSPKEAPREDGVG